MAENEWKFAKPACSCCQCSGALGTAGYFSALLQNPEGLQRQDFCAACFQDKRPPEVFYFWKAAPRQADESTRTQRPVVDVEYVLEFFKRLDGENTPQNIAFRYILALMLTRKKLLVFEGKKKAQNGQDVQIFREKRGGQSHQVAEPALSEEEIGAVSAELGVLLGLSPPPAATPVAQEPAAPEQPVAQSKAESGGE